MEGAKIGPDRSQVSSKREKARRTKYISRLSVFFLFLFTVLTVSRFLVP